MVKVAILGFGTVGSGVAEVIEEKEHKQKAGREISVKRILEIRDVESPYSHLITKNFEDIEKDDEISIVAETMGGVTFAYDFTKRSLAAGKSVVTSNKELVATHGAELLALAKENGVRYLFEASVGGGIPIIRPLNNCLAANEIDSIMGILNGTTNYILTEMIKKGKTFEEALKDAQAKGYAEANPAADVEGFDTCRKIAILSALGYGKQLSCNDIPTEGITHVTLEDVHYAMQLGYVIKLIGRSSREDEGVYACVEPMLLPQGHPLAGIDDVFNGILVRGSVSGDVMFYGRGAGKLPTASAVVADVIDIVRYGGANPPHWTEGGVLCGTSSEKAAYYVRLKAMDGKAKSAADAVFGKVTVPAKTAEGEYVFLTPAMPQKELEEGVEKILSLLGTDALIAKIRAAAE